MVGLCKRIRSNVSSILLEFAYLGAIPTVLSSLLVRVVLWFGAPQSGAEMSPRARGSLC